MAPNEENVRILYLPPMHVAAVSVAGPASERDTLRLMCEYIHAYGLLEHKPDFRLFGFENQGGGYTRWVSAPAGWPMPPPFTAARFGGGLYAAWTVPLGHLDKASLFRRHLRDRQDLAVAAGEAAWLEEGLCPWLLAKRGVDAYYPAMQLDLLQKIKWRIPEDEG